VLDRATRTIPAIEEVRPGIWSLPLPIPGPLVYVFTYAVAVDDGLLLVDAGWDSDEAFAALEDGLRSIGFDVGDIRGVLFTHNHPDHYGLVGRIVEASGAWTALHHDDAEGIERMRDAGQAIERTAVWLEQLGVADDERAAVEEMLREFRSRPSPPAPTRTIADGDVFDLDGRPLVVVHTPGHSAGHVCFVDREAGVVFAGDHVLSATTPNVSAYPGAAPDPLGDYLASLRRVLDLDDLLTLPGHEERVPIAPRAAQIIGHHDVQLASIVEILGDGGATVADVARRMQWALPWEALGPIDRYFAIGEALAHVIVLERRGAVARIEGTPLRWELAA
jgi:glyoxylase-like metal-dependent hydrolase (beta-lactamase superfamily II)